MKGENEFVYFLVAGLVILAVLIAVFTYAPGCFGPGCGTTQNGSPDQGIIRAVKVFNIPYFTASNMIETKSSQTVDKVVYSGLLFGEDKIIYNLTKSGLQDVTIKFTVVDTNRLANMVIKVNDKIIENRVFEPGDYEIKVDSSLLSDNMLIEIAADSSFWKIWAPDLYIIKDVSVTYTSYFDNYAQFRFYLGQEYLNMEFAKIDFLFSQSVGTFGIDLNGRNAWNSPVSTLQSVVLDKADLRLGDNIVRFYGAENSRFAGNATIVIIFLAQFPETINQTGIITAAQPLLGQTY